MTSVRGFISVVILLVFFAGCDYTHGVKQVRATADLQTISGKIGSDMRSSAADLEAVVSSSVSGVNGGKDPWGNPYLWQIRSTTNGLSYVVLSTGSDGELDVPVVNDYFSKSGLSVLRSSEHSRDIVFRDGEAIVTGGK